MAEINIERKRTSILPWIIGLIALALLAWALLGLFSGNERTAATEGGAIADTSAAVVGTDTAAPR